MNMKPIETTDPEIAAVLAQELERQSNTLELIGGTDISVTGNVATGQITVDFTGSGGSMTSFLLDGDNTSPQTITNGNTVLIAGGTNIATVGGVLKTASRNLDGLPSIAFYTLLHPSPRKRSRRTVVHTGLYTSQCIAVYLLSRISLRYMKHCSGLLALE